MDTHFLTPLFAPKSVVVFAGRPGEDPAPTPQAQAVLNALRAQTFDGVLNFLDIHTSGTLADLAQARADLAVIALPVQDVPAALEVAGRIRCGAALVLGQGYDAESAASLHEIARRHGIRLMGPNSLGVQRPRIGLNASVAGPLVSPGPLALVSQSGALTASILDWARKNDLPPLTVPTDWRSPGVKVNRNSVSAHCQQHRQRAGGAAVRIVPAGCAPDCCAA